MVQIFLRNLGPHSPARGEVGIWSGSCKWPGSVRSGVLEIGLWDKDGSTNLTSESCIWSGATSHVAEINLDINAQQLVELMSVTFVWTDIFEVSDASSVFDVSLPNLMVATAKTGTLQASNETHAYSTEQLIWCGESETHVQIPQHLPQLGF